MNRSAFRPVLPFLFAILACLAGALGCDKPESEDATPPATKIVFEGKVESDYVGTWVTANKNSTLILESDGKAKMINVAPGRGTSEVGGEWKIQGDSLLVKVNNEAGGYVSKYAVKLSADKLRLQQKASRLDVEYLRKT